MGKKAIVTDVHRKEAALLKALWDAKDPRPRQGAFGKEFAIGNQSAVGQFLRGDVPLSMEAARGFARGLGCEIADFSPRLAQMAAEIGSSVPTDGLSPAVDHIAKEIDSFPEPQRRELVKLVRKLIRAERMSPPPPPSDAAIPKRA